MSWKTIRAGLWIGLAAALVAACAGQGPVATPTTLRHISDPTATATVAPTPDMAKAQTATRPLLLAHYMPWFQTPSVSGVWGWHWTMNRFNPNNVDDSGRAEIAAHQYPLTGPYDSRDTAILEYQVALMKLSGIDGVIVDWYGKDDFNDYAILNASTHKLFEAVQKAGLLFAICYEDRTVGYRVADGEVAPSRAVDVGRDTLAYLEAKWFGSPNYLTHSGRPVLFVFGNPPYFDTAEDWDSVFADLAVRPLLVTEDAAVLPDEPASYPWPPMWLSTGGVLTREALDGYLGGSYARTAGDPYRVAGAFPGFHDFYSEAGVSNSYGYLDALSGDTLQHTLDLALASDPDVVQLITWNDYGEGTAIEPTRETGYHYLEIVQAARRSGIDPAFAFGPEDLGLAERLLALRRDRAGLVHAAELDAAFAAIVSGDADLARLLLDAIPSTPTP